AIHADLLADCRCNVLVGRIRHDDRRGLGGLAQSLAGPAGHGARGIGHFLSRIRARHGADADLRRAAALAADRGRRQLAALHPALADAQRGRSRDHGAIHAFVVRRNPAGGLRAYGAREGPFRADGRRQAWPAQCADPGRHDDGAAIRLPARRLHRRRSRVQLARHGTLAGRRGRHARLPGHPGRDIAVLARIHPDQPDRRRSLRRDQSVDPISMTTAEAVVIENTAVRTPWTEFWRKFKKQHVAVAAGLFVLLLVVVAIFAPWIVPYDAENFFDYDRLNAMPSLQHWFGVDPLGRDIFSRIVMGARVSLTAGFVSVAVGAVIGTVLGLVAGYYEGWPERIIMRICDVLFA